MTDETATEAASELPPSRRMRAGQKLGVIRIADGRVSAPVVRATACFELRTPVSNRVFGVFYDDGREPDLPGFWDDERRQSVIRQFQALIEKCDRYPQIRRYEATAIERGVINRFLTWLRSEPQGLLDDRPVQLGWLVKQHLVAAATLAAPEDLESIVLQAVGIDPAALAAERAAVSSDLAAPPVFSQDQLDDPRYVKFDVLGSTPEAQT